jgi:hypothetical protein
LRCGSFGVVTDVRPARALYETTILELLAGQAVAITFAVVPTRLLSAEQRSEVEGVAGLAAVLGGAAEDAVPLPNAWSLAAGLALMLDPAFAPAPGDEQERLASWAGLRADAQAGVEFERFAEPEWWSAPGAPRPTPPAVAESLLLSAELPFEGEGGTVSGRSLASVLGDAGDASVTGGAGGARGGALVVAVLAGAADPWLAISAPAGLIVARVADGLGVGTGARGAAHDTIRHRLMEWLEPSGT